MARSIFYRHRHLLGFFVVAFFLYYFIAFGFARIPIGLSELEIASVTSAASFNFPASIVDLPYHALQWLSIKTFDLSAFSIRLPSIVLALATGLLIVATIRNMLKANVAIVAGLIISSSVFFLDIARLGAPMIMEVFLFTLAIFAASQFIKGKKPKVVWQIIMAFSLILGAYSPLGLYLLATFVLVSIFHPKARTALKNFRPWQTIVLIIIGVALIAPLLFAMTVNADVLLKLLGINGVSFTIETISTNIRALFAPQSLSYFGLATPLFSFTELAIAIIGVTKLIKDRHSARSYLILSLVLVALLFAVFGNNNAHILFVPLIFLVAIGIQVLIESWYALFPRNPYARGFGLVPLVVLICSLVLTSHGRFIYSNLYDSNVVYDRSIEFELAKKAINDHSGHNVNLVVNNEKLTFYRLLEQEYGNLKVTERASKKADTVILTATAFDQRKEPPNMVVTDNKKHDNVLLKIYEKK